MILKNKEYFMNTSPLKIIIKTTNIELTPAIENFIYEKMKDLEHLMENIDLPKELRIEVGKTTRHHHQGDVFRAEGNLYLHGELLRSEAVREDLYLAIVEVKDELQRLIKKFKGEKEAKKLRQARKWRAKFFVHPFAWFFNKWRKGRRERHEGK